MSYTTQPRFEDPDRFTHALAIASAAMPEDKRLDFALRLVLLLANQIGAAATLDACVAEAARPFTLEPTR